MADTPLRTLSVTLEANAAPMRASLNDAEKWVSDSTGKMEQSFDSAKASMESLAGGASLLQTALVGMLSGVSFGALLTFLHSANAEIAQLDDTSRRVGLTLDRFQELKFAANVGGLSDKDFASGIEKMATLLNDAQRDENDLTKLFDANNVKWKETNGHVIDVNTALARSADLIANSKTELDKLKWAEMVGLSKEWVPILEQGGAALNKIAGEADAAGVKIDAATVAKAHEFTKEWDKSTAQWSTGLKSAILDVLPLMDRLVNAGSGLLSGLANIAANAKAAGQSYLLGPQTLGVSDLNRLRQIAAGTPAGGDRAGQYGGMSDLYGELMREQMRPAGSGSSPLRISVSKQSPTVPPKDDPADIDRTIDRLQKRIDLYDAETASVGKNTQAKETGRAEAELIAAADKAELADKDELKTKVDALLPSMHDLSDAQLKQKEDSDDLATKIAALSEAYGRAAEKAKLALQSFQGFNQALTFGGDQLISMIDGMIFKTQTLQQLAQNAVRALVQALLQAELLGSGPLGGILGTKSTTGGVGGILGSMFPFGGAGGAAASQSSSVAIAGAMAEGGPVSAGKAYLVGERRPEIFIPDSSGRISPGIGGSSHVTNIFTPPGSSVESKQRSENGVNIEDVVISMVDRNLATGRHDRTMGARFGLTPGAIRR